MKARPAARLAVAAVIVAFAPSAARAVDLWESESGERRVSLGVTLKWSTVLSYAPEAPIFYPERWSSASLWRMRLDMNARAAAWLSVNLASVERARLVSEGAGAAGGSFVLPEYSYIPYRLIETEEELVGVGDTYTLSHDLDRALIAIDVGPVSATLGRQALGWGRGVMFGATDLFAPFTPLESDREWRAGVDAARLKLPLTDLISAEAVAVGGETEEQSAILGRILGYVGNVDGELVVGRRGRDDVIGASASLPVGDTELHGEIAFFHLSGPLPNGGGMLGDDNVAKAVAGGSLSLDWGSGLYVIGEYHYSGFGVDDIEDAAVIALDSAFTERYARGDFSILGRHACALQLTYGLSGAWSLGASWIASPVDGSGVVTPFWSWLVSDSVTLEARCFLVHGEEPEGVLLKSEYGAVPSSVLARISFYY